VKRPPKLAIWDIDGTLASPSLESQFLAYLQREGKVTPARMVGRTLRLACRWPPPSWYQIKLAYVRGETEIQVEEWVERWWSDGGQQSLLPGAAETLLLLKERGIEQLLLSGTADFLARRLARHFDITEIIAGRAVTRQGCYTGELARVHPHGRHKRTYATEWLASRAIDWDDVVVFADHEGDVDLLAASGRGVAVNPQPALAREASRRNWLVVTDGELPAALLEWL
jgi:HAD superfamily hydrolase (TIGR01490 family)